MISPILGLELLMHQTALELFKNGGPVMWPMFLLAFTGFTVAIERIIFVIRENNRRDPDLVDRMITQVENGNIEGAVQLGKNSKDIVARVMVESLSAPEGAFNEAFLRASNRELNRFSQGLPILDTAITAAPLLGLLGTVTGMMGTFGALGVSTDIAESAGEITGGVAEALIATMCGLGVAILTLLPFNYLNARLEEARREIEDVANALEVVMSKTGEKGVVVAKA